MSTNVSVRLDKWLWAARFYKTRSIAKSAIEGGKVHLNGQRCKPGKELRHGDVIRLRTGWDVRTVIVRMLTDKRHKADLAQQLYEETPKSVKARADARESRKNLCGVAPSPGVRPDKKQRREIIKHKTNY